MIVSIEGRMIRDVSLSESRIVLIKKGSKYMRGKISLIMLLLHAQRAQDYNILLFRQREVEIELQCQENRAL